MTAKWHLRPSEDLLLWDYWQVTGGTLYREVAIPAQPGGAKRMIDAIILDRHPAAHGSSFNWRDKLVRSSSSVRVIEVKRELTPSVIGQVATARVAAGELLDRDWSEVEAVALVGGLPNSHLQSVCDRLDIRVEPWKPAHLLQVPFRRDDPLWAELGTHVKGSDHGSVEEYVHELIEQSLRAID